MIRFGTCAWSFDDWKDVFYPPGLAANEQLAYYSRYLPAVEIDSTFYAIPRLDVVANWAAKTSDDFVFTAKMPKSITHDARLRGCERELDAFLGSLQPLGAKLGAVLLQFSPFFNPDQDEEALRDFLRLLPAASTQFAVEFRHPGWHIPRVASLLADRGVAWAWNDLTAHSAQSQAAFGFLPQTASFLYVRLMGDLDTKFRADGGRQFRYGSLLWPRDAGIENWAHRLARHREDTGNIYVLVNNHFEGFSPLTCQRLARLLGIELELPSLTRHAAPPGPRERGEQMDLL